VQEKALQIGQIHKKQHRNNSKYCANEKNEKYKSATLFYKDSKTQLPFPFWSQQWQSSLTVFLTLM